MLRFGPETGPVVVVALPLFEEANRMRALAVAVLRGLARQGVRGVVPDLPAQGESLVDTVEARLEHWQEAFGAASARAGAKPLVVAMRGGTLIDGRAHAVARYHLEPVAGRSLVRDLLRARRAAAIGAGEALVADHPERPGAPLLLAGNLLDRALTQALMVAEPVLADMTVSLFPAPTAEHRLLAPPDDGNLDERPRYQKPWTQSEPMQDERLVRHLVADIAEWIAQCGG